jgi:hypothetical protein
MEKLPRYYFSWIVSSRNVDKCEMYPVEKLSDHLDRGQMLTDFFFKNWTFYKWFKSLKEDCKPGKYQGFGVDISWTMY